MKKSAIILSILIALVAMVIIGWKTVHSTTTVRYKITVSVETPEGIKTGSAVRQVSMTPLPENLQGGAHFGEKREAVVIDLGKRGLAFAVMRTDDCWVFFNAFAPPFPSGPGIATEVKGMQYYKSVEGKKSLKLKNRPLIVAFKDVEDPASVEAVYRVIGTKVTDSRRFTYHDEDNFEKRFGAGVHLKDITIERTEEPVTISIEKYLPLLVSLKVSGGTLSGESFFRTVPPREKILTYSHFTKDFE